MTPKTMLLSGVRKGLTLAFCGMLVFASAETGRRPSDVRMLPSVPAQVPVSPAAPEMVTWRLIVKYRDGAALQDPVAGASPSAERRWNSVNAAARRYGVQQVTYVRSLATRANMLRLDRSLPIAQAEALARDIAAADPEVQYAQADRIGQTQAVPLPNDEHFDLQDLGETALIHFVPPGAPNDPGTKVTFFQPNVIKAWERSTGTGVVVAVLDSGVLPHPDLMGNLLPGYDFVSDAYYNGDTNMRDNDAEDPGTYIGQVYECGLYTKLRDSDWHGTAVAGIIAATANNGIGIAGVAYDAKLLPVRIVGRCGLRESDLVDALVWASGGSVNGVPPNPTPARVINLSLGFVDGSLACGQALQDAIDVARANNSVVVVPAGNKNPFLNLHPLRAPANCDGVITVAAVESARGTVSPYSKTGAGVALAAGGEQLTTGNFGTTVPGEYGYLYQSGTSFAAPVVSGVAALMLSKNPKLTPDEVKALLQKTAQPFVVPCGDQCPGVGIVDAAAAVEASLTSTPRPALLRFGRDGDFRGGAAHDINVCAGFDRASQGLKFDLFCGRLAADKDTHLRYVATAQTILNVDGQCLTRATQTRVPMTFQACVANSPNQRFDFHASFARRPEWRALVPAAGTVTGDGVTDVGEACAWLDAFTLCRFQSVEAIPPETQITLMELP